MQQSTNSHRHDVVYKVDDHVFVKFIPYRQQSLCTRLNEKLAPCSFDPFEVLRWVGQVAYQLKRAIGSHTSYSTIPYQLTANLELTVEPWDNKGGLTS